MDNKTTVLCQCGTEVKVVALSASKVSSLFMFFGGGGAVSNSVNCLSSSAAMLLVVQTNLTFSVL